MTKNKETSAAKKPEQKQDEAPAEKATVEEVAAVVEPTGTEIAAITQGLPPEIVARVQSLLSLTGDSKMGFDEVDDEDWRPPMVKMRQGQTTDYPSSVQPGGLFTDAGDVLEQPWEFIILYMHKLHMRFDNGDDDDGAGQGFCRSEDRVQSREGLLCAECPDLPWRDKRPTACSKGVDVYCFDKNFTGLYRIPFMKTSSTTGERLLRKNKKAATAAAPLWSRVQALTTQQKKQKKGSGTYYVSEVQVTGETVDPKFWPLCEAVYRRISDERKKLLAGIAARTKERGAVGQKVLDTLPKDFGGDSPVIDVKKGGQPKFDDM